MHHFTFEYPYVFVSLPLIYCIYKCPVPVRKIVFPHLQLFSGVTRWLNREKLLYSLIFALLVTALASPISYDAGASSHRKGRDLVFALDASGSMNESGYSTKESDKGKFDILKELIGSFIAHRYDDNVGVVVFGSFAFASVPLTYDMKAVGFLLDFLDVGIAGENTAIGDGLWQAEELLDKGEAENKVILLVTDGFQNSGRTRIASAVARAMRMHVKIYTVGIGEPGDYDAPLLKRIASDTGGKTFSAQNAEALAQVYRALDDLEPSDIRAEHYLHRQMLFYLPLGAALLLLLYLLQRRKGARL